MRFRHLWRSATTFLLTLACASGAEAALFQYTWSAERISALPNTSVRLFDKDKNLIDTLPVAYVRTLVDVKRRVAQEAGVDAELYVTDGQAPNAFATVAGGKNVIGFNIPMLKVFGSDEHA